MQKIRFCKNPNHAEISCYFCERNALILAFLLNFLIFIVEFIFGIIENSSALLSDAGHNIGDAIILGSSLFVISSSQKVKAKLALVKCIVWAFFGFIAIWQVVQIYNSSFIPSFLVLGYIGFAALISNVLSTIVLLYFKDNDVNIKSAYICCRNDAIGNILIILAAYMVYYFKSNIPDIIAGTIIALVIFFSAFTLGKESLRVIKTGIYKNEENY